MDEKEREQQQQEENQNIFPFHHRFHEQQQQNQFMDESSNENLSKVLRNLGAIHRRQQQQQQETMTTALTSSSSSSSLLNSVIEENFTSHASSSSSSLFSAATTTKMETTGGNEELTEVENSVMEAGACPIGKSTTMLQQQKQQQAMSIASSSKMTKQSNKTLSFLHNEDLLNTMGTLPPLSPSIMSIDDKSHQMPASSSSLFRSMSFQERRQYQHQTSLKRVESGKELKTNASGFDAGLRKVTILSPKHSLQELNERIKHMQQQMFHGSSEFSL
jgi:hypothetical protein